MEPAGAKTSSTGDSSSYSLEAGSELMLGLESTHWDSAAYDTWAGDSIQCKCVQKLGQTKGQLYLGKYVQYMYMLLWW